MPKPDVAAARPQADQKNLKTIFTYLYRRDPNGISIFYNRPS